MSEPDYLELSRRFARKLEGHEGVISVGLGKQDGEVVLVVAVDGPRALEVDATQGSPVRPGLPGRFHGLRVVVQDLGEARLFTAQEVGMGKATQLSDEGAVEALRMVAKSWLDNDGARAFAIVQQAGDRAAVEKLGETPPFFARRVLEVLQGSGKPDVARWTEEAIDEVWRAESEGQAQVIDPVTLAIAGATLIGAILAARVRTLGSVEFYEGVPPELVRLLKAGEAILREPLVLGTTPG